ncbi:unnamed protein product [Brachionus calyciflorus]|uniref:LamG domain-containing protein n=1 Tax=Brachionus calyciflorus TaxID=104777 RepID=A0A813QW60_9BILA|nr:unnamed protein product [Brachionus calyciflorus]
MCLIYSACKQATFISSRCNLFTKLANKSASSNSKIFIRNSGSHDSEYYWPIYKSSVKELVQGADLYNPINAAFTFDRFGEFGSAVKLSYGFYQFPARHYFSTDFSVTAWIKLNSIGSNAERLIECGSSTSDSIIMVVSNWNKNSAYFQMPNIRKSVVGSVNLQINIWSHIAFILKGDIGLIYVNGTLDSQNLLGYPVVVNRTRCFLGKSLWSNPNLNADLDDIKIFSRALDAEEIKQESKRF